MFIHPLVDGPAFFEIGPLLVTVYCLAWGIAFILFQCLGTYRLKQSKCLTENEFDTLFDYSVVSIIAGGRIGDILFYRLKDLLNLSSLTLHNQIVEHNLWFILVSSAIYFFLAGYFFKAWPIGFFLGILIFLFSHRLGLNGMSFYGAVIGGLIAIFIYNCRFHKHWLDILDFITPLVPPGLGLGRIANFVNGELWGRPTEMPWGVMFLQADFQFRHPSQLYECVLEGLFLFIILWNFSKEKRPRGAVAGLGMALYALVRILVEFFREPEESLGFIAWEWLTMGQLLSLPMLIGGALLLCKAYCSSRHAVSYNILSTKIYK